jgi:hypothetical protein
MCCVQLDVQVYNTSGFFLGSKLKEIIRDTGILNKVMLEKAKI